MAEERRGTPGRRVGSCETRLGAALDLADPRGRFRLDVPAETARRALAEIAERRSAA